MPRLTVRARITVTFALLTALALAAAGLLVYVLESAGIEREVNAQIDQEIAELRALQHNAVDPETGRRVTDADRMLEIFLSRNVPDDDELLVRYSDGEPKFRTPNGYGVELLADPAYQAAVQRLLEDGGTDVLDRTAFGEVWITAVPVRDSSSSGALVIINFIDDEHEELHGTLRTYAGVALVSLLLLTVVAAFQSGRLLAPLRVLRETASDISATDLSRRIPESGHDDISALTRTINGMLARLEYSFVSQRQFLDDVGHELKTPLTVLSGHLELLDTSRPEEVEETRALLLEEIDRMTRLVGDLILLAKSERPDFLMETAVDLAALTDSVHAKATALGERDWRVDARAEEVVALDEQRITQALLELAANAVKHTEAGAEVAVGSRVHGGQVWLWVRDTGDGVPREDRDRIFERFGRSTVGPGDDGFGLGLSIVRAIAEAHGGAATIEDATPRGARFVVRLPLVRPDLSAASRRTPVAAGVPTTDPEEDTWPGS